MKALQAFVDQYNAFDVKFCKAKPVDLTKAKDRQRIAEMIDCRLSPENLTCDGELSRAQVQKRYTALTNAARDLKKLDPSITFYEFA